MNKPNIIIVGGGAGGLELACELGRSLGKDNKASITLIDESLTHIWKPLWHELAAGTLASQADELNFIALASAHCFHFIPGRLIKIEAERKQISLAPLYDVSGAEIQSGCTLRYDDLILAVGSVSHNFATPGAGKFCHFLDNRFQVEAFRSKFIEAMLHHQLKGTQLKLAIVGGGATGVELAAELHYAADKLLRLPDTLRITLIESGSRLVPALPEKLSERTYKHLKSLGIEVMTKTKVTSLNEKGLFVSERFIETEIKVWAAGIKAPAFLKDLGLSTNARNQVVVNQGLQSIDNPSIFALGDCAACPWHDSLFVPPTAQAAHQQAQFLAKSFLLRFKGKPLPDFHYRERGTLLTLGKGTLGHILSKPFGKITLSGWLARTAYKWLYWRHQMLIYGFWRTLLLNFSQRLLGMTRARLKLH